MTARLRESFSSLTQFIDPEYMPRLLQIGDDWEKFMAVLQYIREQAKARARGSSVVEGADEGEVRVKQMMRLIVNEADDEDDADEVEEENLHGVDAGHVAGSYDHRKVNRLVFDEQGNTALHLVASVVPSSPSTTSASASAATASTSHRRDLVSMVCVARLLQIGADVHRKNRAGVSPLQMVQGMVREEPANSSFKTLLIKMTAAAMVQQIRRKDATGMMRAYLDSVPFITLTRSSSGSGVGEEDGRSAICRTNIMQALNRELFDGDRGSRALHVAVTAGCVQCVKLLVIEFGVDVNVAESRAPSIGARRQRSGKTVLALMERARQGLEREGGEGEGVERLLRRAEMEEMLKVVTMGLRFTEELSEGELDVPDTYLCPITRTLISHPARLVSAGGPAGRVSDTHAYEYSDLKQWVSMHHTSPLTREATSVTQIQTVPGMRVEIIGVKRKMREQYFGEKGVAIEGHVTAGLSFEEWTRERERSVQWI